MSLHTLTTDGAMQWTCAHCQRSCTAHVTQPDVCYCNQAEQPRNMRTVRLPACACGSTTYLKVDFSTREMEAPNMYTASGVRSPTYLVALRHLYLATRMDALGKPHPYAPRAPLFMGGGSAYQPSAADLSLALTSSLPTANASATDPKTAEPASTEEATYQRVAVAHDLKQRAPALAPTHKEDTPT
jgi:hypothetical protein